METTTQSKIATDFGLYLASLDLITREIYRDFNPAGFKHDSLRRSDIETVNRYSLQHDEDAFKTVASLFRFNTNHYYDSYKFVKALAEIEFPDNVAEFHPSVYGRECEYSMMFKMDNEIKRGQLESILQDDETINESGCCGEYGYIINSPERSKTNPIARAYKSSLGRELECHLHLFWNLESLDFGARLLFHGAKQFPLQIPKPDGYGEHVSKSWQFLKEPKSD